MKNLIIILIFIFSYVNLNSKTNLIEIKESLCKIENYINISNDRINNQCKIGTVNNDFNYNLFKMKLSILESYNNDTIVNKFGYMGRYQFGHKTLKSLIDNNILKLTYNDISKNNFLKNRGFQEKALRALTYHNFSIIKKYGLIKYNGTKINGVKITIPGMLAAAHLRGAYSVKKFILTKGLVNHVDGNNTSVMTYISKFESSI